MRRPGAAREAQRGDAIGVADEGASVSRVGGERAEKDHRVARGVGVELAVRAAPVREVGSVPVGRGGIATASSARASAIGARGRGYGARVRRRGWAPPRFTNETAFPGTRRGTATSYRARTRTICMRSRCVSRWGSRSNRSRVRARCARAGLGRPDRRNLTFAPRRARARQGRLAPRLKVRRAAAAVARVRGGGGRVGLKSLFENTGLLLNEHVDYELRT